jgi:hypothetical protein
MAKHNKAKKLDIVALIGRRGAKETVIFNSRKTTMDSRPKWARTRSGRDGRATADSAAGE